MDTLNPCVGLKLTHLLSDTRETHLIFFFYLRFDWAEQNCYTSVVSGIFVCVSILEYFALKAQKIGGTVCGWSHRVYIQYVHPLKIKFTFWGPYGADMTKVDERQCFFMKSRQQNVKTTQHTVSQLWILRNTSTSIWHIAPLTLHILWKYWLVALCLHCWAEIMYVKRDKIKLPDLWFMEPSYAGQFSTQLKLLSVVY